VLVRKGPFGDSVARDACAHVLLQTSPRDIDTVMVDGEIRMRTGMLAGFEPERAAAMIRTSRQRILG
jgi:5-methylthioadenosine/S-adenosylhomocysteine deaminase